MPPLVQGHDRIVLVDSNGDGAFSITMIYTDPNSFGSAVPFSNLVIYDPVPGRADLYRIAYDHRLAYGRKRPGASRTLGDFDLTGDDIRDITLREVACAGATCTSAFYVIQSSGDGLPHDHRQRTRWSIASPPSSSPTAPPDGVRDIVRRRPRPRPPARASLSPSPSRPTPLVEVLPSRPARLAHPALPPQSGGGGAGIGFPLTTQCGPAGGAVARRTEGEAGA